MSNHSVPQSQAIPILLISMNFPTSSALIGWRQFAADAQRKYWRNASGSRTLCRLTADPEDAHDERNPFAS
jgi:hypothetical protein